MLQQHQSLDDYLAILARRKWQFLVPAAVVFLSVAGMALSLPSVYQSTGTILIEQQEIPSDLVQSTVTTYAGERLQVISQKVMTTENLLRIVDEYGLYQDLREAGMGPNATAEMMRKSLSLDTISAEVADTASGRPREVTIAFSLSFDHRSPVVAQQVASDVIELFLEENVKDRRETAEKTSVFLEAESERLAVEIAELERQLADFKERNADRLPELMNFNLERMRRTEELLRDQDQTIRSLEEKRILLQSELALTEPYSALYSTTGERVLTPGDRLQVLEAEYIGLSARYAPTHPDRIRVQREIEALRKVVGASGRVAASLGQRLAQQEAELRALTQRYSEEHPDVQKAKRAIAETRQRISQAGDSTLGGLYVADANNPAYLQVRAQLDATEADLRSAVTGREELQATLVDYEARITETPQIEREYKSLTRDYENAVSTYQDITRKLTAARLAETLETESKGERFTLLEAANLPQRPDKPNRLGLIFLGFVLAVGGGMGHAVVREALDKRVYGPRSVQAITGAPPMAVIPRILTDADRGARRRRRLLGIGLGVAAAFVLLLLVDLLVVPLEDLFAGDPVGTEAADGGDAQ